MVNKNFQQDFHPGPGNNSPASPANNPTARRSTAPDPNASLAIYLKSIVHTPYSIKMLCLTNLFCWMAHVCYSLYFTDFVGEAVFNGNPTVRYSRKTNLCKYLSNHSHNHIIS